MFGPEILDLGQIADNLERICKARSKDDMLGLMVRH